MTLEIKNIQSGKESVQCTINGCTFWVGLGVSCLACLGWLARLSICLRLGVRPSVRPCCTHDVQYIVTRQSDVVVCYDGVTKCYFE